MKENAAAPPTYEEAIARLVERVRRGVKAEKDWSPTPLKKELESMERQLRTLAGRIHSKGGWSEIEEAHGHLWAAPGESAHTAIQASIRSMLDLAESARYAADILPNPRERPALPDAAMLFLHVLQTYGKHRPTLYDEAPEVKAFEQLLADAGAPRSIVTVRNLLSTALKKFDQFMPPSDLEDLLQ